MLGWTYIIDVDGNSCWISSLLFTENEQSQNDNLIYSLSVSFCLFLYPLIWKMFFTLAKDKGE